MSDLPSSAPSAPASGPWSLVCAPRPDLKLGERPLVMGIVNITPDSFSDGGRFLAADSAVEQGLRLVEEGADILDLGAESTRPGGGVYGAGSRPVDADQELKRLLPVLDGLRRRLPETWISVDTRKGAVARRVLEHGADLINDVGGLRDPELASVAAEAGCPVVIMHSRGELSNMQKDVRFDDAPSEVARELEELTQAAVEVGVRREQVIVDPGIGFGKQTSHNLELIASLDRLGALGRPVLLGASRKSFIDGVSPAAPDRRLGGSLAAAAWGARHRAAIVRVHDVAETAQFLRVWNAIDSSC